VGVGAGGQEEILWSWETISQAYGSVDSLRSATAVLPRFPRLSGLLERLKK